MRHTPLVVGLLIALAMPLALAQVPTIGLPGSEGDAQPTQDGAAPLDPIGGADDALWGDLDLTTGVAIGVGVAVIGVAAAIFFLGGAKFVNAENVLDNEARKQIFTYIQEHPGVHLRAAATQLNLSTTNVLWHLRKLEDANLITSKKFEGYKVFYPVEGGVETKRRAIASSVLKNDNAAQILAYVSANPSAHQREIARALGVNHGTVRWHLRKLEEAELLTPHKKEHTTHYYLSDLGNEALAGWTKSRLGAPAPPAAPPVAGVEGEGELH